MPDPDAPYHDETGDLRRTREAARIFRTLEETPNDAAAIEALEAFLARGDAERETYARMARALGSARTGLKRKAGSRRAAATLSVLLFVAFFAYEPAKIRLFADRYTTTELMETRLASGDAVTLDAASAVVDRTDGAERQVTLLQGAAYFDVVPNARPFIVEAKGLTVAVLGTAFEVAEVGGGVMVTVLEGQVKVAAADQEWQLAPRDRLVWSARGASLRDDAAPETVASWRLENFITDGMTLAQVAAVLDRRLPGRIVITDSALAQTQVSGGLNLSAPLEALRLLAASTNAEVVSVPRLVTILHP